VTIPANITIRPGQYARFACLGRFLRVEDMPHNGLGLVYRAQSDGSLQRVFGL
jgi:hypothetical protein